MAKNDQASKKENEGRQQSSQAMQKTGESRTGLAGREFSPWTGSPFTFMRRFTEEMDRLFDDFGWGRGWLAPGFERGLDRLGTLTGGAWSPQVEVFQRDNKLIVRTDLPGMTKDDINVEIDDDALVIRGERKSEREENEKGYYRTERSYGSFYRRIPLPSGVNPEEANAEFRNGVLEITMPAPQRAEETRRRLEIRGEGGEQAKAKTAAQK
ncbi:MAG TPA: Hsp20/alpha crystallin family protein [Pyrinomonadaceae bacterium]|nr:Hsp20/alpha crystallin family protein [Pyrinomonadaceae bacterium]